MEASSPQPGLAAKRTVQLSLALLQDLSECLVAVSEDPSSSQGTESDTVASKLRTVLRLLITQCVEGGMRRLTS